MRIKCAIASAILATFVMSVAAPANAGSLLSAPRALGSNRAVEEVRTPIAYRLFCLRNPDECVAGRDRVISHSSATMRQLARVNGQVNASMRAVSDARGDRWSVNSKTGDCEDFALTKRSKLVRLGFPAGALRIAVVRTEKGDGHAVLVVRTSNGDYVLDNRRSKILKRDFTGYRWLTMASSDPRRWVKA